MRYLRQQFVLLVYIVALIVFSPQLASANLTQDILGLSPRVNAIGGAGTALAVDFAAIYYNPANLTRCVGGSLTLAYDHVQYGLEVDDHTLQPEPTDYPKPERLRPLNQLTIGACAHLPFRLSFGFLLTQGIENMGVVEQSTTDEIPRFILYGQRFETMSTMLGSALRLWDNLSVGFGLSFLPSTEASVPTELAVFTEPGAEIETPFSYRTKTAPKVALYTGIHFSPIDSVNLGLVYRSSMYFEVRANIPITMKTDAIEGGPFEAVLDADAVVAYSPHQVALGATYEINTNWLLAADLTWYHWSADPGPFIKVEKEIPIEVETFGLVRLEPPEAELPDFRDVFVPRIGTEYRFEKEWKLRGGYSYRPTPAPLPKYRANILDADTHSISIGGGYRYILSAITKPEDAQTSVSFDIYAVLGYLCEREVSKREPQTFYNDFHFSGWIFTGGLGVTLTL